MRVYRCGETRSIEDGPDIDGQHNNESFEGEYVYFRGW